MSLLYEMDYSTALDTNSIVPPWTQEQEPNYYDPSINRMTIVESPSVPGGGPYKPIGRCMRVELRPYSATNPGTLIPADGDICDTSGYLANRSEGFIRAADPFSTPAASWPDPVGTERWYAWSFYLPVGFPTDATGANWLFITQWKGRDGGTPPFEIAVKRSNIQLSGTRTFASLLPNDGTLAAITTGSWMRLKIGFFLSPDPAIGWVNAYCNDSEIIPRMSVSTMDYQVDGITADPISFKQGIYRASTWAVNHTIYIGPVKIGDTEASVALTGRRYLVQSIP